ncbi:recombinase family protein [Actinomadura viridis]|uniref:recombinase family protein n=1 Tax=Actinomadura viridis TaxID=58110 RepID=UPI0036B9B88F
MYDRVSNDPTGSRRSVEEQDESNRAVCAAERWHLAENAVYCDNDRSASRFATKPRPDWDRLRADVAARRYHVVVLWEVSRGDRDDLEWIGFLHMCRKIGVLIHITSHYHTYDPQRRRDYKTLAEEGLDSADEVERTSERIQRDTEAMARKGRPHGTVPYGYIREYEVDRHGQRHIVSQDPDTKPRSAKSVSGEVSVYTRAGIVKEIARRLLRGEASRSVAADLNRRGVPAPAGGDRGWSATAVRRVAISPTYAGLRSHHGEVVADGTWTPLVDKADHYTLVARLSDQARRKVKDTTIKHLGSGLYVCGVCGSVVRPITRRNGMAYTCRPAVVVARNPRAETREVTADELAVLAELPVREQTGRILDLVNAGVTQASVSRGLGLWPSTLSLRLKAERVRRGETRPAGPDDGREKSYHVARAKKDVDDYVERAVWLRLARPDLAELLTAEDARAEARLAELTAKIAEMQVRLDNARDSYASGNGLSLEGLLRVESTLEPAIKATRTQLAQMRVGPVLDGLLLPDVNDIRAVWLARSLPQRRAVIRALIERVEILPLRSKKKFTIEESVRIVWRGGTGALSVAGSASDGGGDGSSGGVG